LSTAFLADKLIYSSFSAASGCADFLATSCRRQAAWSREKAWIKV
jgi:hypothetical protein